MFILQASTPAANTLLHVGVLLGRGSVSQYKRGEALVGGGTISCGPAATLCSSSPDLLPPDPPGPPPSSTGTSTMDSSGLLRGLLFVGLLSVTCHGQASQEVSAEDFGVDKPEPAADRDLVSICNPRSNSQNNFLKTFS